MHDASELTELLQQTGALQSGHFLLTSGLHSSQYIQCALLLQHPDLATRVCAVLAGRFRGDRPEVVIGPAYGGIIVAHEVARALHVRALFAERVEGRFELRRSFRIEPGERTLVVENVVTTGGSTREVKRVVEGYGGVVIGVGTLVSRAPITLDFDCRFEALLTLTADAYEAAGCPMCRKGIPLLKPGSRSIFVGAPPN